MSDVINHLEPPFLELGFYFSYISEQEAFAYLVEELLKNGSTFSGKAQIQRQLVADNISSSKPKKNIDFEVANLDLTELKNALLSKDVYVSQVALEGAIGIAQSASEVVKYGIFYTETSPIDNRPIILVTEGEMFSGPEILRQSYGEEQIRQTGQKVYQRFKHLVQQLNPDYASITIEYGLECPTDLKKDLRTLAFYDFFASRRFFDEANLETIQRLFEDTYQEELVNGIYFS